MKFDCYVVLHRRIPAINAGAAEAKMRNLLLPVQPIPECEQCGSNRITDQGFDGLHCDKCGHDQSHREPDVIVRKAVDPSPLYFLAEPKEHGANLPVAIVKRGVLTCSYCRRRSAPILSEYGYTVRHHLHHNALARGEWIADAGDSSDRSDEGTHTVLECGHCSKPHQLPAGAGIDWR